MQITTRPAAATDLTQVAAVNLDSWRLVCLGRVPPECIDAFTFEDCLASWHRRFEQMEDCSTKLLVAEEEGDILGFSYFGPCTDPDLYDGGTGQIYLIYLKPDAIGCGLGKKLMDSSLSCLASCGYESVTLWVLTLNERAREFYSHQKFLPDGSTDLDYRTGTERMRYVRALTARCSSIDAT